MTSGARKIQRQRRRERYLDYRRAYRLLERQAAAKGAAPHELPPLLPKGDKTRLDQAIRQLSLPPAP